MIFGIIIGVVLGFVFKPQIENGLRKVSRYINDQRDKHNDY